MITDQIATRQPSGRWKFTWSPGTPPYSIWLDGRELIADLLVEEFEYETFDYQDFPPPLEILEDTEVAENETYPPHAILQWRGLPAAAAYEIEQEIATVFTVVESIMEVGLGYYSWQSDPLTDVTEHKFRVVALDIIGNEGTPIPFSIDIVRNPPTPSVSVAVSGGDIIVSAS